MPYDKPYFRGKSKSEAKSYSDFYKKNGGSSEEGSMPRKRRFVNLEAEKENDSMDKDVRKAALQRRLKLSKESKGQGSK